MQTINIFLGSSFHLMSYRKHIGDAVRTLNDKWLGKGVRIHLFKWEDFPAEYRGKSKQQEYIDDMVLKSQICMFLFADSIGRFTKRELEAKLKQDATDVHCYRVRAIEPKDKKKKKCRDFVYVWHDEIIDELKMVCGSYKDLQDEQAVTAELTNLVEGYIASHNLEATGEQLPNAWNFYTTIPEDNARLRAEFSDTFRSLDDFLWNLYGTRCVLLEREKPALLKETDHYVPLMKHDLSDADFEELEMAVDMSNKKTERLKDITFFKNGSIYPNVARVKDLLEKNEIFPKTYNGYETLKCVILEWLLRSNHRIVDVSDNIDISANEVKFNGEYAASLSDIDSSGKLTQISNKVVRVEHEIEQALEQNNDTGVIMLQNQYQALSSQIAQETNDCLNGWAFVNAPLLDQDQQNIEAQINKLNFELKIKIGNVSDEKSADRAISLLEGIEMLTRELVLMGFAQPQRLLAVQMKQVSLYDTYITDFKQPEDEDILYRRIIEDADRLGLHESVVEMMRMNYANSLSRLSRIQDAACFYIQAISNLKAIENKSSVILHNITQVYMHLCNLYADNGMHDELNASYDEFKDHIESLDEEKFPIDYCQLAALRVKKIPKNETGHNSEAQESASVFIKTLETLRLSPNHTDFADIFVFFPNSIAAFFIDHCADVPEYPNILECLQTARKFARISLDNAKRLMKYNYGEGLFMMGEALHQLGFVASKTGEYREASEYYDEALAYRKKYAMLSGEYYAEPRIAQTLVNKGALLLQMHYNVAEGEQIELLNESMLCAETAREIYHRHIQPGIEMTECNYFEALQLKGTIHYAFWEHSKNHTEFDLAIGCFRECWRWNIEHPLNHYSDVFRDYSGAILQRHGLFE